MLVPLDLPPGIYDSGTEYQSKGRWNDGNLVRFYDGQRRPVGGWRKLSKTAVSGKGRELTSWRARDKTLWAGIGTDQGLFVMTKGGTVHDVTPAGFTVGRPTAINGGGYGAGTYGSGVYGQPRQVEGSVLEASVWSLDQWGENLVGVMDGDNIIYEWTPNPSPSAALPIVDAPTARSILVTGEFIMMALGADNNPRLIRWCNQQDNTDWTPVATNQAGDVEIPSAGELLCGVVIPDGALIFTETDVTRATYTGAQFVYEFEQISDGAGAISQNSVMEYEGQVVWMGPQGFWNYNGFVSPLPCTVSDRVFANLNRSQISKVTCFQNSQFGEIWWFYPGGSELENSEYVVWSYRENHWTIGKIARLSATDMSPFRYPLAVGDDGFVYEHEIGRNHGDMTAFLKSGPLELGVGESVIELTEYIPDTLSVGDAQVSFCSRYYPNDEEIISTPIDVGVRSGLRIAGRQHSLILTAAEGIDWRFGVPRVEVRTRGKR